MAYPVPTRLNVAVPDPDGTSKAVERHKPGNRLLLAQRRQRAWRLKSGGLSSQAIALHLAADPSINSLGEATPGGYGAQNFFEGKPPPSHEQLRKEASADLALLSERNRESIDRDEALMFDMAIERIETGIAAIWNRVGSGSQLHVGRMVELLELEARLMGWIKSPVTVSVDNSITMVSAESKQPETTPEYMLEVVRALKESGIERPETIAAIEAAIPPVVVDADVIEGEVVEA